MSYVPAGQDQQGRDMLQRIESMPSINVEITNYIGNERAFSTPYTFYSRDFLQENLDVLTAIEKPSPDVTAGIEMITKRMAEEKLWLEDVLEAAGIPALEGLWSDAFSASLDTFPQWVESQSPIGGIPVYMRQLEWDAKLDLDGDKSVTVTMGLYPTAACESEMPVRKTLQFESGVAKRAREATIAQLETLIADRKVGLTTIDAIKVAKALPPGATRTAQLAAFNQQIVNQLDLDAYRVTVANELAGYQTQLANLQAVTYGTITSLLGTPSVGGSIKGLIVDGILATLQKIIPEWSGLDMQLVSDRFFLPPVE